MNYFLIAHIAVSLILIVLIMLQHSSDDASGVLGAGGGGGGGAYQTRRGMEKGFFIATIVFIVLFIALALLNLVLPTIQNLF